MSVDYQQLIEAIQHEAELSWDDAERAAEATLTTLGERLSAGEAADIAEELEGAGRWLRGHNGAQPFDVDEFLRRVAEREDTDVETAERHARAVFTALTRTLSRDELHDVLSELPKNFGRVLPPEYDRRPPPPPMPAEEFIARVADHAATDQETARRATEAVLQTLAVKLSGGEVDDLAEQLPGELQRILEEARTPTAQRMSLAEFVQQVAEREDVSAELAREHTRAVFQVLREAVSGAEWADMTSELSDDYTPVLAP